MERWFTPGQVGIVFSVSRRDDGSFRLVAGDVDRDGEVGWQDDVPVTFKDFGADEFLNVEVSERALADIGLLVVARLAARAASDDGGSDSPTS